MQARSIPLGALLIAWIAVTALIALNRGIDLLWGVTLLIAVATGVAAGLPRLQVHGVNVRRVEFPPTATVGRAESIAYEIETQGGWPRYGVEVFDRLNGETHPAATAYLHRVRGKRTHTFVWTPQVRGCWQLRDLIVQSRYPLGLTRAIRTISTEPHEITVYPDFVRLHWLPVRNNARPRFELMTSPRRGGHDEFFGLKPYAPGDDRRSVHWRASARAGEIVVKEYEHQQDRQLWILLELAESMHVGAGQRGTCEQMIRIAHSIAVKAQEEAIPVGVMYRVADSVHRVPAAADRATYLRIRDVLARVNAHAQLPLAKWMQRHREQMPEGGTWFMFNLGDDAERTALERFAQQRRAAAVFVEFDKASYASTGGTDRIRTFTSSRSLVSVVPSGANLSELFKP